MVVINMVSNRQCPLQGLEIALHEPGDPLGYDSLVGLVVDWVVRLDIKDWSAVDGVEATDDNGLVCYRDELHSGNANRVRTIFGTLGEDSEKRHGGKASGSAYQLGGWIKRSLMEIGQDEEMGKLVNTNESITEIRQKLDTRSYNAPILIGLGGYSVANVSNGVHDD